MAVSTKCHNCFKVKRCILTQTAHPPAIVRTEYLCKVCRRELGYAA